MSLISGVILANAVWNASQSSTAPSQQMIVVSDTSALASVIDSNADNLTVESYVRSYFKDEPILAEVARCESHFRQFNTDGTILRGKAVHTDVGVMQINEKYQLDRALQNGYDIYTLDGNLGYAKFLYDHQGLKPWASSSACWNSSDSIALR